MRYQPLHRFLGLQDADQLTLSFSDIEAVLNRPLPASARRHQAWWANTASHAHAKAWLNAGRRTAALDLAGERVSFVRDRLPGVGEAGAPLQYADVDRGGLTPAARKWVESEADRRGLEFNQAATALLNESALERRRALIAWLAANSPRVEGDSTDLIREDRDAR